MIDRQTVERIKAAANIVDVVSEFVTLKKVGANYKGLCPFHNEKTPSFYVSPARGTCHCFGCGKGGNAITFIMEHEQMTYPEALRWLARKYHIEIRERELTTQEKEEQTRRESMFIVNEWAQGYFEDLLHNHPDGVAVGMQYLRSRGFRDDTIREFHLGYDLPDRHALAREARQKGYQEEFLTATGICYRNDRGELIDRYAGRVVFPWTGVNGKVVGFTARVLDARTKGVNQKYVNSPDSDVYHKDHELYGIWQAKKAIAKEDRVFMVEGQADVIAMHQCGLENVVANSGTALSVHQIHTLHRFTQNITLIYDGDAAGIHAALRGTDMLLAEGMNVRIMLLPGGQDPDEFSRSHTADEFKQYIDEHQEDFIQFKTDVMLKNETDPAKRAEAIGSIVQTVSLVPNQILRATYIHDCAIRTGLPEAALINQMNNLIRNRRNSAPAAPAQPATPATPAQPAAPANDKEQAQATDSAIERMIAQLIVRHGERVIYQGVQDDQGQLHNLNVAQYVSYNLAADGLHLENQLYNHLLDEAVSHSGDPGFQAQRFFTQHEDIAISRLATELSADRYHLSLPKGDELSNDIAEKQRQENETENLRNQTEHLLLDFRMAYVKNRMQQLRGQMKAVAQDMQRLTQLMEEYRNLQAILSQLAKKLGTNIIV